MLGPKVNRRPRRRLLLLPGLLLGLAFAGTAAPAWAQEPYATEPLTAKASAYLPQSLVDGLDPQGLRLTAPVNGLKTTVCELWLAKTVSTHDAPSGDGILYGSLKVGEFVGVIHYVPESSEDIREDFRDQKLRAGYYTMRYARMPEDKAHKDVNPYRDFVLLSPVSVDRHPAAVPGMDDLLRWSRFASRTRHPAVISLVPVDSGQKGAPLLRTDDSGTCILQVKLHAQPETGGPQQDLTVAMILVTPIKETGES
jgi:hypothetical protein